MALASYAELQSSIITWAWRRGDAEFAAFVPDFIVLAEQLLNYGTAEQAGLRVADMEVDAYSISLTDGVGTLPADFLEARGVTYGNDRPFDDYIISGTTIQTDRQGVSPLAVSYYAKIPALSDDAPTNWLLQKAPSVYLFGSLLQAKAFMEDAPGISSWAQLYQTAIAGLQGSDAVSRFSRAKIKTSGPTP